MLNYSTNELLTRGCLCLNNNVFGLQRRCTIYVWFLFKLSRNFSNFLDVALYRQVNLTRIFPNNWSQTGKKYKPLYTARNKVHVAESLSARNHFKQLLQQPVQDSTVLPAKSDTDVIALAHLECTSKCFTYHCKQNTT